MDRDIPYIVHQGITAAFKAVLTRATQESLYSLAERCGTQGLFGYNNIVNNQIEARGNSIAEGDTLALSIRACVLQFRIDHKLMCCAGLAAELILGRYDMPQPLYPSCLLSMYEIGLIEHARGIVGSFEGARKREEFNWRILPRCQILVEAVGHQIAYESAAYYGVDLKLLDLYEARVMLRDPGWFVKNAPLDTETQLKMEMEAMDAAVPRLEEFLDATGAGPYCTAPIASNKSWTDLKHMRVTPGWIFMRITRN
ncbi:hypothetical protein BDV26DRAFT_105304 [Aspergillus bertholletiae]|uniref:Acyl-CoA dehydrogenase/oxidase C-terminal n=1 Tax=Aspergillus bertholletiae TaxID=1226010 RepID=A0A5N7ASB0_9EURO|nr:hypothetical protein BDV26DRAFT_105304 [Aspergillus bertholletiae]